MRLLILLIISCCITHLVQSQVTVKYIPECKANRLIFEGGSEHQLLKSITEYYHFKLFLEKPQEQFEVEAGYFLVSLVSIDQTMRVIADVKNYSYNIVGKSLYVNKDTTLKSGKFKFENADIHSLIAQICSTYDLSMEYKVDLPQIRIDAVFYYKDPVENILSYLLNRYGIHIIKEGKKLIVLP